VFRHGPAATGTGAAFGSWAAGLAAVGAVFLYGVFAAAGTAPPGYREPVGTADSRWLAHAAVVTSLSTVVLALILGSAAAALAVVYSKQKQGEGPSE